MNELEENKKLPTNTADVLREKKELSAPLPDEAAKRLMAKRTRRGFLVGAVMATLGGFGYAWLRKPQNSWIFDRVFRFNENVSQKFFNSRERSPEFSKSLAGSRLNGNEGLSENFDPANWRLQVTGLASAKNFPQFAENISYANTTKGNANNFSNEPVSGLILSLADIKELPRVEMTTELKCIEGWSVVVNWAGARFSDFAAKYLPATQNGSPPDLQNRPSDLVRYISLVTPDRGYYVGWDMPSILHPQTLLCYEMNGAPLTLPHGGPLRLVTTTKYGIKQIKRIGRITFTDERPKDYWNERGYDWYSGL
jgi:DMSO/TMAO reductase YedYZ molybdopterin-dependent catalytic subunit